MDFIEVTVRNFESYKGRADVTHNSWFRMSNRILEDPEFFEFTSSEFLVWIYILCQASKKNQATIQVFYQHAHHIARLPKNVVNSAIEKLKIIRCIDVVRNRDGRGRYVDDTQTCATRHNKHNKTDKTECRSGDRPPDFVRIWNDAVKSLPKVKAWTDARSRLARKIKPEDWAAACTKIEASDFLSGRSGRWTSCSIDWALKPANVTKILEGTYDNREAEALRLNVSDILGFKKEAK